MKVIDRQYPRIAMFNIAPENITGNEMTVRLPPGSLVTRVFRQVTTAFDGASPNASLTVTDGTTVLLTGDLNVVGGDAGTVSQYYPAGATITATVTPGGGGTTAGDAVLFVEYMIAGSGHEVHSN